MSEKIAQQQASPFELSANAKVHVETLASGCPVLIIDDCYARPEAVRELALGGRYDASLAYYPGVHSQINRAELLPLYTQLARVISLLGSPPVVLDSFTSDFSLVTTPAREMLAGQKHPHVDSVPLAGVLYLNPDYEIGTSFFRHRPTGLAFLRQPEEHQQYAEWMGQHGDKSQPETYAVADDTTWEHLHSVEGRFNRLVMYPGTAFHSIAMRDVAKNLTLASARLTQRFFVNTVQTTGA